MVVIALLVAAVAAISVGAALIYPPAGLIVAGLCAGFVGLDLADWFDK